MRGRPRDEERGHRDVPRRHHMRAPGRDVLRLRASVHGSIEELDAAAWDGLIGDGNPFLRHAFLAALERTGCVGPGTGWEPSFLALSDARGLAAAVPAWVKTHSYGEFVFDFGWAQAYARAGRRYYPKLTVAVPFTPATGPRLLVRADLDRDTVAAGLLEALAEHAAARGLSSVHALFLDAADREACERAGWLMRRDCQFHWNNRGYASFEDYLGSFTAEKRKKARRERRRVAEAGIHFETLGGGELSAPQLDLIYALHRDTFLRHGHEPYLTRAFFGEIAAALGEAMVVKLAVQDRRPVATAIFFRSRSTLYGRYWGVAADFHSLHFEACYHQGIEYCIAQGLARFEPGTQGEHKVSRGFEPTLTWSAHFIVNAQFRAAIGDYLGREAEAVDAYAGEIRDHVPYRREHVPDAD